MTLESPFGLILATISLISITFGEFFAFFNAMLGDLKISLI